MLPIAVDEVRPGWEREIYFIDPEEAIELNEDSAVSEEERALYTMETLSDSGYARNDTAYD